MTLRIVHDRWQLKPSGCLPQGKPLRVMDFRLGVLLMAVSRTFRDPAPTASGWLSARQAAAELRVGTRTIFGAIASGRLEYRKLNGRDFRIHRDWLRSVRSSPGTSGAGRKLATTRPARGRKRP